MSNEGQSSSNYSISVKPSAQKSLSKLPRDIQISLAKKIEDLKNNPHPPGSKKIRGRESSFRIRQGNYRLLYEVDHSWKTVVVAKIGHRSIVYR